MPRPRHCRDSSDHVVAMPRHRRGRDGSDIEGINRGFRRGRHRPDHVDTRHGSHRGRGRSGSSSGSDRRPLSRKRSRTRQGSLAPLRGYVKAIELRKAKEETRNAKEETRLMTLELTTALEAETESRTTITDLVNENRSLTEETRNAKEEKRLMTLELTTALEAETESRTTITDLVNENRSLTARNRTLSEDMIRVSHKLAVAQERSATFTENQKYKQEHLERQLSVALQTTATLQDWIDELSQRSRSHVLLDHCARLTKSLGCENDTGRDDLTECSSRNAGDDSVAEPASVTLVPSQPRSQPEAVKETTVGTNGIQHEICTSEQSEPTEQFGDDPVAEKDPEQSLSSDGSIGVADGRSDMPSPCGEPRAFQIGDAFPKQSFQ